MQDCRSNGCEINGTVFESPLQYDAPRRVVRGAKFQTEVGIDWFRVSGPWGLREKVIDYLERAMSGCPGEVRRGRYFYDWAYQFANGAAVLYDDASKCEGKPGASCCVEIPGNVLACLGWFDYLLIMKRLLSWGMRCTRIDVCVDFIDQGVGLWEHALEACEADALCGARRFKPVHERGAGGAWYGRTLYIGLRGNKGSGRFIRIYDKGLEQDRRKFDPGYWERFEVEFSGDCAAQVALAIVEASEADPVGMGWVEVAADSAFGSVDFREAGNHRSLERRSRLDWWESILEDREPVRVSERREPARLDRFAEWVRRSVAPSLSRMAAMAEVDHSSVWRMLVGEPGVDHDLADECRPVIWEWLQLVRNGDLPGAFGEASEWCEGVREE